jgi:hypothetical protein
LATPKPTCNAALRIPRDGHLVNYIVANIFATDRQLAAIQTVVDLLAAFPEKKAMIYFSNGSARVGIDNQAQLRATTNAAIRANVSIYSVDSRGLSLPPR